MALQDDLIRKIRAEAVRQGLQDPDLAVAVAMKESSLKPEAWGDRGASLGLFQLQRAAALDAGIDPARRQDVDLNIEGGVRYLKQKLAQSGGNVEQALRRYNSGTPTFQGLGDPGYVDRTLAIRRDLESPSAFPKYGAVESSPLTSVATRGYRMARTALTPRSAAAATLPDLPDLPDRPPATGGTGQPGPTGQPATGGLPNLPGLPDRPPASAPATTLPAPGAPAAPGAVLPWDPGVSTTLPATPPGRPAGPEDVTLLGQPVPSPGGGGSLYGAMAPTPPAAQPFDHRAFAAQELARLQQEETQRLSNWRMPAAAGISAGSAMLGTAAGSLATPFLGPAGPLVGEMAGSYLGRQLNIALGLEEGQPWSMGPSDIVATSLPVVGPALKTGARALARGSRAGKVVTAADEATRAAQQTYQEGVERTTQETAAGRAAAVTAQQAEEAAYQARVMRQRQLALTRHEQGEAARQAKQVQQQQAALQEATDLTQQQQQAYQLRTQQQQQSHAQQVQEYQGAVGAQRQAVATARAVPGGFAPETPSRTLYNRFRDIAPDAQVPLTQVQETAHGLHQQMSRGFETVTPTRMQAVLEELQALPEVIDGLTAHRLMQDIGPLTRSPNRQIRGAAKQLYAGFQEALEKGAAHLPETAEARQVLLAANKAARREFALDDVHRILRRSVSRTPEGEIRINAAGALDKLDLLYEENKLFQGSWTPEEWQQLTSRVGELTQTPRIPGTRPGAAPAPGPAPAPVQPKAVDPFTPTPFEPPAPPSRRAPRTAWKPSPDAPQPPEAVQPSLTSTEELAKSVRNLVIAGGGQAVAALIGAPGAAQAAALLPVVAEITNHLLLRQDGQKILRSIMNANGTINRSKLLALTGGRAALEQAQQEGRSATPQEDTQAVGTLRQRYVP